MMDDDDGELVMERQTEVSVVISSTGTKDDGDEGEEHGGLE